MNLDRDALAVVPHRDEVLLRDDVDPDLVHRLVSLEVVRCIHKYFICKNEVSLAKSKRVLTEYFVKSWDELNPFEVKLLRLAIEHPQLLTVVLYTADIGIRSK